MKSIVGLVIFVTLASSTPLEKDKKSFSLFNIVSFPNAECQTNQNTVPATSGVCMTSNECGEAGGTPQGNCASAFGICCFIRVTETDTLITQNITYIENLAYPENYGGIAGTDPTRMWRFRLEGSSEICQIRFDFEDVVLQQPIAATTGLARDGICGGTGGDSIGVTTSTATMVNFDTLCGTLSGQHIYIHNSVDTAVTTAEDAAVITINIGNTVFERRWKIKTTRIECNNLGSADEGCLQWFTGLGGTFQSFNNNPTGATRMMISNLIYSICIRKEEGMCGMTISQTRNSGAPDAFNLATSTTAPNAANPNTVIATPTAAGVGATCTQEGVGIGSSKIASSFFCGGLLAATNGDTIAGSIPSDILPLRVFVVTSDTSGTYDDDNNGNTAEIPVPARRGTNTGFDLRYAQTPCSP